MGLVDVRIGLMKALRFFMQIANGLAVDESAMARASERVSERRCRGIFLPCGSKPPNRTRALGWVLV